MRKILLRLFAALVCTASLAAIEIESGNNALEDTPIDFKG